ncbi:MAG: cell division protein SepF [Oscillospiraceae bacterium]|nr:cell division protein SepF [Oscillospiraceae bacterium]
MGILDTLKNLTRPYDDEDDYYDDDTEMETEIRPMGQSSASTGEKKSSFFTSGTPEYDAPAPRPVFSRKDRSDSGKVMNLNGNGGNKVVFMKPERYETSKEICDHLQSKRIVLLNLDDTSKEIARRILDFMAGATYALGGKITRISSSTYIITPYSVDLVGGDLMDELENSGFFF